MKCPKCHYLSFEPEPRCKNCGYDLLEPAAPELAIKPDDEPEGPLADLDLQPSPSAALAALPVDAISAIAVEEPPEPSGRPAARVTGTPGPWPPPTAELPLFIQKRSRPAVDPDEPLVKVPSAPRQPLGVRRPTPERLRPKYQRDPEPIRLTERDLLDIDAHTPAPAEAPAQAAIVTHLRKRMKESAAAAAPPPPPAAGVGRRLEAALIDALFLSAIDVAMVWLTLQQCELTFRQTSQLPLIPLAAFLMLVNVGYLLMFTAITGQTVGKMAAHIRVVAAFDGGTEEHLSLRQALMREILTIPSVLAFGLGFIPALKGDHRALHDRLSHTRVVRA